MNRAHRTLVLIAALIASASFLLPTRARAQDDEAAVRAVVVELFDAMRARDTTAMRDAFHPEAQLFGVSPQTGAISASPIGNWIGAIARAPEGRLLDEVLHDTTISIDGALANVWTYYDFFAGDDFSHCGYDAFILLKGGDGWKIVSVADSRRQTDCRRQRR